MKRILLLLIATATLGLASCKKDTIVNADLPNETFEDVINPSAWTSINNGETLTTTIPFPEINSETFKNDAVLVYIYPDNKVPEYRQLPFTYNGQAYSYTARQGSITIDIETSGDTNVIPIRPTIPIGLRVVIVTSRLN